MESVDSASEEPDEDETYLAESDYGDEDFTHTLVEFTVKDNDPRDSDWIPVEYRRHRAIKRGE